MTQSNTEEFEWPTPATARGPLMPMPVRVSAAQEVQAQPAEAGEVRGTATDPGVEGAFGRYEDLRAPADGTTLEPPGQGAESVPITLEGAGMGSEQITITETQPGEGSAPGILMDEGTAPPSSVAETTEPVATGAAGDDDQGTSGAEGVGSQPGPDAAAGERAEPVIDVPDDAERFDQDTTVADEKVAVAPDGSVVDTRGDVTDLALADGTRITVDKDGTIVVDGPEEGEADRCEVRGRATLELENGTKVAATKDGVVVTTPDGESFTVNPDGSVAVDLPDETDPNAEDPNAEDPGAGDPNAEDPNAEDPNAETPDVGDPDPGPSVPPGGGTPPGGTTPPGGSTPPGGTDTGGASDTGGSSDPGYDSTDTGGSDDAGGPGDPNQVTIDPDALRSNANAWRELGSQLKAVDGQVKQLSLEAVDFGLARSLHGGYESLRIAVGALVTSGAGEFENIADGLTQSATSYETTEQQNTTCAQNMV